MALDRWLTVVSVSSAAALGGQQAAFLVDADNFSDALALESAWAQVQARAGRVSVCRAYGAPTRLQSLAAVWRSLGARTFPNLALDKNTTDAALIADAVALHFQQGVRLFAIASGDADFAPLAVRLREWGCEVWCFSMGSILFAGAEAYYDRVVGFAPTPTSTLVSAPVVPVPVSSAAAATALVSADALPDKVLSILKAVPELRHGPQMLSRVMPVLRQQGILAKTTKTTAFFAKHLAHFQLIPAHQPTQLAYVPRQHPNASL